MYPIKFSASDIIIETFHKFGEIDIHRFINAYKAIFEREFPIEVFTWYEMLNEENIWAIAYEKSTNNFIAIYGLMPISFFLNGRIIRGYLCHNTGVIPKYQGKGLFQYIGEIILHKVLKGNEIVIGFPNRFAVRGYKAIGWQEIGKMIFYEKKEFREYEVTSLRNIYELDKFPEIIDNFTIKVIGNSEFSLKKDYRYLNWRISKPNQIYKCFVYMNNENIDGYMIYKVYYDQQSQIQKGHIIDIVAENDHIFTALVRKAEKISSSLNLDILNVWVFEKSYLAEMLIKEGFYKEKSNYDYSLIIYSIDSSIIDNFRELNKEKIIFSLSDNDVF